MMKCVKCSKSIPDDSVFCLYCGKKQVTTKTRKRRQKGAGAVIRKGKRYEVRYKGAYIGMAATPTDADMMISKYKADEESRTDYYNYTVEQVFEQWTNSPSFDKLSVSVQKEYKSKFKHYFDGIKKMRMRNMKAAHFQDIIDYAAELYSYDVCAKLRTVASGICRQAMKNDIINKNYAQLLDMPERSVVERTIFTDSEIKLLWNHKELFYVKVILALIYTGLRPGEMFQTKCENVNLDEQYMITGIKTEAGKNRLVPIADKIIPFVKDIVNKSNEGILLKGVCTQDHFGKEEFRAALKACGIERENLVPYSCRHTFYTLCKKEKVESALLIKIFGHANEDVGTDYYFHPDVKEKLHVVNSLISGRKVEKPA